MNVPQLTIYMSLSYEEFGENLKKYYNSNNTFTFISTIFNEYIFPASLSPKLERIAIPNARVRYVVRKFKKLCILFNLVK